MYESFCVCVYVFLKCNPSPSSRGSFRMWKYMRVRVVWSVPALFSTVHPLDVFLVVCFELLAFQFECVSDQASLRGPGFSAQPDLLGNLKSLQFCWLGGRRDENHESD